MQEFDLSCASDGRQKLTLYLRNLTVIVEDLVADVSVPSGLSFELLERNSERAFDLQIQAYGGK